MRDPLIFRVRFAALLLLSLYFLQSCSKDMLEKEEESTYELSAKSIKDSTLIEGQYIVILSTKPGKKNPQALAALEALSKEITQMPEAKIRRTYSRTLVGFTANLTDPQVQQLQKDPRIETLEQDSYIYLTSEPLVQEYPDWGLDRIDQRENTLDRVYSYTATGTGVTAYLVDTGIRSSHTEFGGRVALGYDFVYEDEYENTDPSQGQGDDCWGIGTAVAAVLGGAKYGVAKNVQLRSVRVWGCEGPAPRSRLIAAVDWITNDVVEKATLPAVVNMTGSHADSLVAIAIENSIQEGIVYVGVAGNNNEANCEIYPDDTSGRLSVGASDIYNKKASFSNYGNCVDLYAPGEAITSASHFDDNSFVQQSSTSMSSPFVAGVAALYLEVNPLSTPAQTKTAIVNNSTPNAIADVPSGPNSLIYSLWEPVEFTPPEPPNLMLTAIGERIKSDNIAYLTWNSTESPYVSAYIDGVRQSNDYLNDGEQQITLPKKGNNATYILKICEIGYDNCSEEVILVFGNNSEEPINATPVAGFTFSTSLLEVQFNDASTDSDGSIVAWNWDFGDGTFSSEQHPLHSFGQAGTFSVSLTVTDDVGNADTIHKNVTVSAEETSPGQYELSATGYKVKGQWHTDLSWTPSNSEENIDIWRNGTDLITAANTGTYTDVTDFKGSGSLSYKVCEPESTSSCSNEVTVQF